MSTPRPQDEPVTLTVDGSDVMVPRGTLIIRAAESVGIEIPRFCDHPFLDPIGACRQCYVEIEGQRKLFTSCTTEVAPGMVVRTQNTSDEARRAQVANLEFLLLNHPLDCPICDRGGECPLQDQAMAFGPGESRYTEPKRTYEKPIALSPLVELDRERCVLCARCTRFCDEISGDRFIELFARGAGERVSIAAGEDFRSPFSGNTVQICPVGALTAEPYRFVARPFDLTTADSVCQHCSAGCNVRVDLRRGSVVRVLARDNADVNDAWTCDKGRFAFRHADLPGRVTMPLIRDRGLEPASFDEVFARIAEWSRDGRVAFLSGGRLPDEDAYALAKLARVAFGTNDLDHRRTFHGGHAELLAAASPLDTTYRDVERAKVILVAGLDAEQEVPILNLRIRKAARRGAAVFVIHPRRTRLWDVADHTLCLPEHQTYVLERIHDGDAPEDSFEGRVSEALREAAGEAVVLVGERLTEHPLAADVALTVAQKYAARMALVPRRAGDRGALRAGVHPSLLPGGRRVSDQAERAEIEGSWGSLPAERGRSTRQILEACANRELDVLFLIGIDPLRDVPDADLVRRALSQRAPRGGAVARARLARAVRRRLPPRGRVDRARGPRDRLGGPVAADPPRPWPRRRVAGGLGDLRGAGRGDGAPARVRGPRGAPGGGRSPARAALGDLALDRVDRDRTAPAAGRAHPAVVPAARGRGAAVRRGGRAQGGPRAGPVRRAPPRGRRQARARGRRARDRDDRRGGGGARRARHGARRAGRGVRAVQPARARRERAAERIVHDGRPDRTRGRGARGREAEAAVAEGAA